MEPKLVLDMQPTAEYAQLLQVACEAALAAGDIIRQGWGAEHAVEMKGATNPVTEVDHAAEDAILAVLRAATPDYDILTEESGAIDRGSTRCWVIDPLDGTTNYMRHFPYFGVSIGLEEDGESIVGVVYDPVLEQTFTAVRGQGAFLNGEPIHCSGVTKVSASALATGITYDVWETGRGIDQIARMIRSAQTVRINGCAALDAAYVACGRLDAYCDTGVYPWDIAASRLLITEAGGTFRLYGDAPDIEHKYLIASNGLIAAELEELLITGASSF